METLRDTSDEISSTENVGGDSVSNNTETFSLDIKEKVEEDPFLPSFEEFPEEYKEKSRERIEKLEVLISEIPVIEGRIEEFSSLVNSLEGNYALLQGIENRKGKILEPETHELINKVHSEALRLEEANEIVEEGGDATSIIGPLDDEFYEVCIKPRNPLERLKKVHFKKELGEEEYNRRKGLFKKRQKEIIKNKMADLRLKLGVPTFQERGICPTLVEDNYDESYLAFKARVIDDFAVSCQYYLQQEEISEINRISEKIGSDRGYEELRLRYESPPQLLKELKDTLHSKRNFFVDTKIASSTKDLFRQRGSASSVDYYFQKLDTSISNCDISKEEYHLLKKLNDYMTHYVEGNDMQEEELYYYEDNKEFLKWLDKLSKYNSEGFPSQDNLSWHGIGIEDITPILKTGKLMSRRAQVEESDEIIFTTGGGTKLRKNDDGTYVLKGGYGSGSLPGDSMSEKEMLQFLATYSSQNGKRWFDEYNQLYFTIDQPYQPHPSKVYFCFDAFKLRKNRPTGFNDGEYLFHEDYDGTLDSPGMGIDLLEENYLILILSESYERSIKELEAIYSGTRLADEQTFQEWVEEHVLVVDDFSEASEQVKNEFWKRYPKEKRSKGYFMPTGFSEPDRPDSKLIRYKTVDEQ